MIIDTSYQRGAADDLLSYMERDGYQLETATGDEMSQEEKAEIIEKSEKHEFEREIIISPERDDLDDDELARSTRQTMTEFLADQPTADYCYAVHNSDDDRGHVHVATTGDIDNGDLYMDSGDIQQFRDEIAAEKFQDRTLEERREQAQEQAEEQEQLQERVEERDRADDTHWLAPLLKQDQSTAQEQIRGRDDRDDHDPHKLDAVRSVVETAQSNGIAQDMSTDTATGLILAKIEDPEELDEARLRTLAKDQIHEIDREQQQDRGMGR